MSAAPISSFAAAAPAESRAEVLGFFAIGLVGLALNQVLLFMFVHFCKLDVGFAKAPTAASVFMFNFLLRRALLFVASPRRQSA